ncbi:MAG: TRAP transporter small permease subunit [Ectothiorhodospiraceae bacterium]|nr:TRAP transporter small permease subunit [Ectothiorhodospiraceae bacterium]MCH8503300.1 TRAP transporter small permease [Ectothiorhodospiraceae bacterium]
MRFWIWIGRFEWGLASIGAGLCLLAMMLMTVISVFGRYVLGMDLIPGAYNMIERILFPLIVFWALPLAHREGTFPKLEMLSYALPERLRLSVSALVLLVEVVVFAVLLFYVSQFAWNSYLDGRRAQIGTGYWQLYPVLAMVPLAFGLMWLEMVRLFVRDCVGLVRGPGGAGPAL